MAKVKLGDGLSKGGSQLQLAHTRSVLKIVLIGELRVHSAWAVIHTAEHESRNEAANLGGNGYSITSYGYRLDLGCARQQDHSTCWCPKESQWA